MLFSSSFHRWVYLIALAITACSLPFSPYTASIGIISMLVNFILEGQWRLKLNTFKGNRALWISYLLYLPILYSAFYSSNFPVTLKELRLWLPFIVVPTIVALSRPLNNKEFKWIMLLFVLAVLVASIISSTYLFSISTDLVIDVRQISLFISHIRFSLMVNLAIAIIIHYVVLDNGLEKIHKFLLSMVMLWLVVFLFILQSFTGIVMLFLLVFMGFVLLYIKQKSQVVRFVLASTFFSLVFIIVSTITHKVDRYYTRNYTDFSTLMQRTVNGTPYQHDTVRRVYENGNLLYINICDPELSEQWARRSTLPFDSLDNKGQPLNHTIIRYLTSLGYTKDSVGIWKLSDEDIAFIENGATSVVFKESKLGIDTRLYQLLWEIDAYRTEGSVSYSSVIQRLVFAKAALFVIKDNFWVGVGWGDIQESLNQYYKVHELGLPENLWFMPHNQYLTVWVGAGFIGLAIFMVALLLPFILRNRYKYFLPVYFLAIIMVSMLSEDTFESHIGITFAVLFGSLFIFGDNFLPKINESNPTNL